MVASNPHATRYQRDQLDQVEGLMDQTMNGLADRWQHVAIVECGHDQNDRAGCRRPRPCCQAGEDTKAVDSRHHQIEQKNRIVPPMQTFESHRAIDGSVTGQGLVLQGHTEHLPDPGIVIHDQYVCIVSNRHRPSMDATQRLQEHAG